MIKIGLTYKVSTANYFAIDAYIESYSTKFSNMFAVYELQGTDWLTTISNVQTHVNLRARIATCESPFLPDMDYKPRSAVQTFHYQVLNPNPTIWMLCICRQTQLYYGQLDQRCQQGYKASYVPLAHRWSHAVQQVSFSRQVEGE